MDPVYQKRHLEFVSNNNGSSISEIVLAGIPVHLSPLLISLLATLIPSTSWWFSLVEFAVILCPPLLSLTVFADKVEIVALPLAFVCLVFFAFGQYKKKSTKDDIGKKFWEILLSEGKTVDAITNFRSSMLLVTATCILAVDFPIFPRKFAKTEEYGFGLMDLGVGGFMFAAGLVSPESRNEGSVSVRKALSSCVPLLILGLGRLLAVTSTGYHENVTEYGTHWNFFFTLAAVKVLSSIISPLFKGKTIWIGSVVVAVVYEGFLSFGLVDWIMSDAPRDTFLSANREGVSSSLGYLAIYMAGVSWGGEILMFPFTVMSLLEVCGILTLWSILMWLNLIYSSTFFLPPSRRLANYTFFTWVVAYQLTILSLFFIIELFVVFATEVKIFNLGSFNKKREKRSHHGEKRQKVPAAINGKKPPAKEGVPPRVENGSTEVHYCCSTLYRAISYNSLLFFLLANLMTGCVNMLVPTIETDTMTALAILLGYLTTLCLVVSVLYKYKIKLKCW